MVSSTVDNVLRVPSNKDSNFFRLWVSFLSPYHDLTDREADVLTCLLKSRHELLKEITNEDLLYQVLFSEKNKRKIYTELGISNLNFNVLVARLKKKNLIINDKINNRFIPALKSDSNEFKILILFEFKDD